MRYNAPRAFLLQVRREVIHLSVLQLGGELKEKPPPKQGQAGTREKYDHRFYAIMVISLLRPLVFGVVTIGRDPPQNIEHYPVLDLCVRV
jgi:hypothetical protein